YGGLERWLDPLAAAPIERPPMELAALYRFFLKPFGGLIVVTLIVSFVAAASELALFGFLGSLVDRMAASPPQDFVADNFLVLIAMAVVVLVVRPVFTVLSRGLINLAIAPSMTTLVRWRSYRYVLRQSLGFFHNDFAGRISQKVMQTGMA